MHTLVGSDTLGSPRRCAAPRATRGGPRRPVLDATEDCFSRVTGEELQLAHTHTRTPTTIIFRGPGSIGNGFHRERTVLQLAHTHTNTHHQPSARHGLATRTEPCRLGSVRAPAPALLRCLSPLRSRSPSCGFLLRAYLSTQCCVPPISVGFRVVGDPIGPAAIFALRAACLTAIGSRVCFPNQSRLRLHGSFGLLVSCSCSRYDSAWSR